MPTFEPIQKYTLTSGGTTSIDLTSYVSCYYITSGTLTLGSSVEFTGTGTPYEGMRVRFEWNPGTITIGTNHITFLGTQMPDAYASKKVDVDCYYNGSAWIVSYTPDFQEDSIITTAMIVNDAVTTDKIAAKAITTAEMADLAATKVYVGDETGRPAAVSITGDISLSNAGAVAYTPKSIVDADISDTAAIRTSALAASADIAKIANVTQAELEYNHDVTAGTAAASKAVVLSATSKIDTIDITVLKINGYTVTTSATELSELNSAGVLHADFELLYGLSASGVTAADLQATKGFVAGKAQRKTQTFNADGTVDADTEIVIVDLATDDVVLTLPDIGTATYQCFDVIVRQNVTTFDLTFDSPSSDSVWYDGTDATSQTLTNPVVNSIIKVANSAAGVWTIGK